MNNTKTELLKKNPKIDSKVVAAIAALENKLPESARTKNGSDYKLTPPLAGNLLTKLPLTKIFEANFPMYDHVCEGREYRLVSKEKTDRTVGGKKVIKNIFALVEDENSTP